MLSLVAYCPVRAPKLPLFHVDPELFDGSLQVAVVAAIVAVRVENGVIQ